MINHRGRQNRKTPSGAGGDLIADARDLEENQQVEFEVAPGPKGPQAIQVRAA
jgi:'Cold-shock' DNA-binding domain